MSFARESVKFLASDVSSDISAINRELDEFDEYQHSREFDVECAMDKLTAISIKHDRILFVANVVWQLPPDDQDEILETIIGGLDVVFEMLESVNTEIQKRISVINHKLAQESLIHMSDNFQVVNLLMQAKIELQQINLQIAEHRALTQGMFLISFDRESDSPDKNRGHDEFWDKISLLHKLQRRVHHYHVMVMQNEKLSEMFPLVYEANPLVTELNQGIVMARKNALIKLARYYMKHMQDKELLFEEDEQSEEDVLVVTRAHKSKAAGNRYAIFSAEQSSSSSSSSIASEDMMDYQPISDARL